MKKIFTSLHARVLCHATEDLDKVTFALENVIGKSELKISKTQGHHGNPITVIESVVDGDAIDGFFSRLGEEDLKALLSSLSSRVDDGCNLFIRIDKQAAFKGVVRLGTNDDVVSLRLRVAAFPARCEIAIGTVENFLGRRMT